MKDSVDNKTSEPRRVNLLVVDDHAPTLKAIARVISQAGHSVATAADGREAMAMLPTVNPELIITDVMMPGFSGIDFLKAMKLDPQFVDVPVVMLTASTDPEHRREAIEAGVWGYYLKGEVQYEDLLQLLTDHARRSSSNAS